MLMALTRHSLQLMLNICEEFSNSHDMLFSTDPNPVKSKTKCLYFSMNENKTDPEKVILNGDKLPWVSTAKHLGNVINTNINKNFCHPDTGVFPGPFWVGLPHPNEFLGKNGELFQNNFGEFFQNIGAF